MSFLSEYDFRVGIVYQIPPDDLPDPSSGSGGKTISLSMLQEAYTSGRLSLADFLARLKEIGYSGADVSEILAQTPAPAQAQATQAVKDKEKEKKDTRLSAEKARDLYEDNPGAFKKWLAEGDFSPEERAYELKKYDEAVAKAAKDAAAEAKKNAPVTAESIAQDLREKQRLARLTQDVQGSLEQEAYLNEISKPVTAPNPASLARDALTSTANTAAGVVGGGGGSGTSAPTGAAMSFPPNVERWRGTVSQYFKPEDVDKALWVIQHESGGNPDVPGDGGHAIGLFQHNDGGLASGRSLDALRDPEANIRLAAEAVYGGQGWKPWGENNLYQGKPFGALGSNPFPGGGGSSPKSSDNSPDRISLGREMEPGWSSKSGQLTRQVPAGDWMGNEVLNYDAKTGTVSREQVGWNNPKSGASQDPRGAALGSELMKTAMALGMSEGEVNEYLRTMNRADRAKAIREIGMDPTAFDYLSPMGGEFPTGSPTRNENLGVIDATGYSRAGKGYEDIINKFGPNGDTPVNTAFDRNGNPVPVMNAAQSRQFNILGDFAGSKTGKTLGDLVGLNNDGGTRSGETMTSAAADSLGGVDSDRYKAEAQSRLEESAGGGLNNGDLTEYERWLRRMKYRADGGIDLAGYLQPSEQEEMQRRFATPSRQNPNFAWDNEAQDFQLAGLGRQMAFWQTQQANQSTPYLDGPAPDYNDFNYLEDGTLRHENYRNTYLNNMPRSMGRRRTPPLFARGGMGMAGGGLGAGIPGAGGGSIPGLAATWSPGTRPATGAGNAWFSPLGRLYNQQRRQRWYDIFDRTVNKTPYVEAYPNGTPGLDKPYVNYAADGYITDGPTAHVDMQTGETKAISGERAPEADVTVPLDHPAPDPKIRAIQEILMGQTPSVDVLRMVAKAHKPRAQVRVPVAV